MARKLLGVVGPFRIPHASRIVVKWAAILPTQGDCLDTFDTPEEALELVNKWRKARGLPAVSMKESMTTML